jgi:hypothetical protein
MRTGRSPSNSCGRDGTRRNAPNDRTFSRIRVAARLDRSPLSVSQRFERDGVWRLFLSPIRRISRL